MTELIPVEDARAYVMDTADDMIVVEFPRDIYVSKQTAMEIERRLQEFVKREVLPLLREEGIHFSDDQIDDTENTCNSIWTYVLFGRVKQG